ncbi:hypothetical protein EON81_03800 [bacterium]|nr:MAG: hypothetical protein EON81_03800 [bacterium]
MKFRPVLIPFLKRVGLWFAALWIGGAAVALFFTEDAFRAAGIGAMFAAGAIATTWLILLVAWFPLVLPGLASARVASRQEFFVQSLGLIPYVFQQTEKGWTLVRKDDKSHSCWLYFVTPVETDLAARLVRVWQAALNASIAAMVLSGSIALVLLPFRAQDPFGLVAGFSLAFCGGNLVQFLSGIRKSGRTAGTVIRHLRAGDRLGQREMAWTMLNSAHAYGVRPRDIDLRWIGVAEDWLPEEPMNTIFRYHAVRFADDTEAVEKLQRHRAAIVECLEAHRESLDDGYTETLLWYAAFLSEAPEEAKAIGEMIARASLGEGPKKLLEARIAALEGRTGDAKSLGEEVLAAYEAAGDATTFERDGARRFLASLTPPEGETESED